MGKTKETAAESITYPIEYQGYQIFANLKSEWKKNPISGHEWPEPRDARGFTIQGPGANRTGRQVFQTVQAAKDEIDTLIKFPSPVQPMPKPRVTRKP